MAYGFEPVKHAMGGTPGRTNNFMDYTIADQYNVALYYGDAVAIVTGGTIARATTGDGANPVPCGVFAGCEYVPATGALAGKPVFDTAWPASTDVTGTVKAYVYDDPYTIFKVEADQDTTALAITEIGNNVDFTVAAGSATTKKSGMYVDSTDGDLGASAAQLRILGSAEVDAAWTDAGTAQDIFVRFNEHQHTATAGV